jgi:hypothetical protein
MGSPGKKKSQQAPMTLHAVMQASVGMGLRSRYKAEQEIPHGLLVLLMQMNDDQRRTEEAALHDI